MHIMKSIMNPLSYAAWYHTKPCDRLAGPKCLDMVSSMVKVSITIMLSLVTFSK